MHQRSRLWSSSAFVVFGLIASGCAIDASRSATDQRVQIETTANTWTRSTQTDASIASDASGNLLVVWSSKRQEDHAFGIFAQCFDPLGRPIGTEIHVNETIEGGQYNPSVAIDQESGNAMIAWESTHHDGAGLGLVGRWFEPTVDGLRAHTGEFPINTTRNGDQTKPSVAINGYGEALVAWTSESAEGLLACARRFDLDGAPRSPEFRIGCAGAHSPIAAPTNDGFLVAGASRDFFGVPNALWMQRITANGAIGAPIEVVDGGDHQDIEPAIGVDASGNAVIAWMRRERDRYEPVCRGFDAEGQPRTRSIRIEAQSDGWLSGVAVAVAPDGRFNVSWNDESRSKPAPIDGSRKRRGSDVVAQRFDRKFAAVGDPERVHLVREGRQRIPIGSVATRSVWTSVDQIAHVWSGRTDSDSNGVGFTLTHPQRLTAEAPLLFEPRPAITRRDAAARTVAGDSAKPIYDPNFIPDPPEVNVRGAGPDFGFFGDQQRGAIPPDPEIAVGAEHVLIVVNSRMTIRRKTDGVQISGRDLFGPNGFWSELGSVSAFDPIAQYDVHTDRFVVAAAEHDNGQMYLLIAITEGSDPNGAWIKHRVNMTAFGTGMDYPILGVDDESISITVNFFGDPLAAYLFIFDKAALIAGAASFNAIQVSTSNPPTGAMTNYDVNPPAQYYASTWSSAGNRLRLIAVTDPNGSPSVTEHELLVPGFSIPVDADQLGSTELADTVDWRIKHGVVRNGAMWVAHNTKILDPGPTGPFSSRDIAKVRWYEIALNGWPTSGQTPTLTQTGLIDSGFGIHTWHPDISVDDNGNAAMVFSRSSKDEFISTARAVRRVTDPPGTFRQAVIMQTSTSPDTSTRWGDYAGIQEDPFDPGVFWSHGEYRTSSWRTWVGKFSPLTPNPLDFALLSPPEMSVDVRATALLDWEDAQDADSYDVTIATDSDLINTVAINNVTSSSWSVPDGVLECGVRYYWSVTANSVGGQSVSTPGVYSFTTGLLADLNDDNIIDTADLGILIGEFGTIGDLADLNNDGIVDTADLGLLIASFGDTCD